MATSRISHDTLRQRRLVFVAAGALALAVLLFSQASAVLMLFFVGILLAAFLSGLAQWLERHSRIPYRWSVGVVVTVLLVLTAMTALLMAPEIGNQFVELTREIPKAWAKAQEQLNETSWGRQMLAWMPEFPDGLSQIPFGLGKASEFLSSTLGVLANVVILFFIALYLALEPDRYIEGLVCLVPHRKRDRMRKVFCQLGVTIQRWLMGRLLLMGVNAVVTALGLWALGLPMPITLGVLSGLLNFIPNIGPIAAAVPAVLLGFVVDPWTALYVALFYFAYQMLDGYVFTPLVQRRTVLVPPALTLMSQVLLGVLLGAMGVVLADPLLAVILVLIKMLYVEDVIGDETNLPGDGENGLKRSSP